MNRIQKAVVKLLGLKELAPGTYPLTDHSFAEWAASNPRTHSGKTVTETSALQITTVFACVRVLAEAIGSLPLAFYEKDVKTGNAQKIDHELGSVLVSSPNANMTGVEYIEAKTTNLGIGGNAYSIVERRADGSVISLEPIPSKRVRPKQKSTGEIYYEISERGKWVPLPQEQVWHVKGFGNDGLLGLSPVGFARQQMGLNLAAEEFQARFFSQGLTTTRFFSVPQWLDANQRVEARKLMEEMWQGMTNAHKAQLLEGGMKMEDGMMPPEDAQFLQLIQASDRKICGMYRVPPHMVADLERSTNNNIEHQGLEFVMYTLAPWLRRIETSISKWLLLPSERSSIFARFNVDALLRADSAARGEFYSKMLQNGVFNRNEVRALENRNSVEGLDDYTVQSNMTLVDQLAALVASQVAKNNAPASQAQSLPAAPSTDDEDKSVRNFVVNLPDSMKHQLQQSIELPGIKELVAQLRKANAQGADSLELFRREAQSIVKMVREGSAQHGAGLEKLSEAMATLTALAQAEREVVCDQEGNPIRSRIVRH